MEYAHSGVAGTRLLHAFVTVLARQLLDPAQQSQVETILALHEKCLARDEERKAGRREGKA